MADLAAGSESVVRVFVSRGCKMFQAGSTRRRSCGKSSRVPYHIHRLKENARQQFRWAPHTIGLSLARSKDYEPGHSIDARTVYEAWLALKDTPEALQPGDILESDNSELRIFKYVGFEEAQWQVPEVKPEASATVGPPGSELSLKPALKPGLSAALPAQEPTK